MSTHTHQPPRGLTGPADTCPPCHPSDAPDLASDPSAPSTAGHSFWPIPDDVAASIVAAGHPLSAEPVTDYGRPVWRWSTLDGTVTKPSWSVVIDGRSGRGATARHATLAALARLASEFDDQEAEARAAAKRVRLPHRKAQETEYADASAKRAADVRALAERVAAMWPEVTP